MRKTLKILHTLGSSGMIGGLGGALLLIYFAPQATANAYADMRHVVALLSDYVLLPSLGIVLVSGLLAMVAHSPYMNKGWALMKALFGIIVLKAGLHLIGAQSDYAVKVAEQVGQGVALAPVVARGALQNEVAMIWFLLALSIANVVVGVWRPRFGNWFKAKDRLRTESDPEEEPAQPLPKQAAE